MARDRATRFATVPVLPDRTTAHPTADLGAWPAYTAELLHTVLLRVAQFPFYLGLRVSSLRIILLKLIFGRPVHSVLNR